jgi:molecular chaperone DnaJ
MGMKDAATRCGLDWRAMTKNYYLILGIGSDATQDEIRSAYREKAKRWHPDRSGEGSEPFLAIREAYEVLCDPGRRQAYDQERARQEAENRPTAREVPSEPLWRVRPPVEPLVPGQGAPSPSDAFVAFPPSPFPAEFFHRPWSDLDAPPRAGSARRPEEIHVEVSLSREQARHGGRIRIWIPLQLWCPACQGQGGAGFFTCPHCLGSGTVIDEGPADITFPGGVVDGFEARASLARPGMRDLLLTLHFRVAG